MELQMKLEYQKVLVTGAAGFIGFHLARRLLKDGYQVVVRLHLKRPVLKSLKTSRISHFSNWICATASRWKIFLAGRDLTSW
jgi:nucleoside-diphosphate-sugar epimerase